MSIRPYAAVIACAMSLYSCGFETNDDDKFKDKSANKVDQSGENGADATSSKKPATDTETNAGDYVECDGIALHGFHLFCDDDDIAANDAATTTETEEKPKTEVVVDKPVVKPVVKPVEKPVVVVPPKDPNIVEFRIKAGTGNAGWNTQAEIINAKIGQTVRVFNDDTVIHRMHTGGSPCPHGVNIPVGGSQDCVITKAFDATVSNGVYDHIAGTAAKIWLKAD